MATKKNKKLVNQIITNLYEMADEFNDSIYATLADELRDTIEKIENKHKELTKLNFLNNP